MLGRHTQPLSNDHDCRKRHSVDLAFVKPVVAVLSVEHSAQGNYVDLDVEPSASSHAPTPDVVRVPLANLTTAPLAATWAAEFCEQLWVDDLHGAKERPGTSGSFLGSIRTPRP